MGRERGARRDSPRGDNSARFPRAQRVRRAARCGSGARLEEEVYDVDGASPPEAVVRPAQAPGASVARLHEHDVEGRAACCRLAARQVHVQRHARAVAQREQARGVVAASHGAALKQLRRVRGQGRKRGRSPVRVGALLRRGRGAAARAERRARRACGSSRSLLRKVRHLHGGPSRRDEAAGTRRSVRARRARAPEGDAALCAVTLSSPRRSDDARRRCPRAC